MRNIYTEKYNGKLTFSRQIGSYPILIGIPGIIPLNVYLDVKVVDYGYRSITAVPFPLNINSAKRETIEALPYIGKKRATRIMVQRPFNSEKQLINSIDDLNIGKKLLEYISFKWKHISYKGEKNTNICYEINKIGYSWKENKL